MQTQFTPPLTQKSRYYKDGIITVNPARAAKRPPAAHETLHRSLFPILQNLLPAARVVMHPCWTT